MAPKQLAVVGDDRGRPRVSARTARNETFACKCIRPHSTRELNQKLIARRRSLRGVYTGGNNLWKKLGVKEGGGRLLEEGVFSGAYGDYNAAFLSLTAAQRVLPHAQDTPKRCIVHIVFTVLLKGKVPFLH